MTGGSITIRYLRPPDRLQTFAQRLVQRTPECVVTLLEAAEVGRDIVHDGELLLADGAPIVWFTFPDTWHDIGRFHTADGSFTGCYANVLTPIAGLAGDEWHTTDLFLDVWLGASGVPVVLDADELAAAERAGHIGGAQAARARAEAAQLCTHARSRTWPPPIVHEWTLEAARAALSEMA